MSIASLILMVIVLAVVVLIVVLIIRAAIGAARKVNRRDAGHQDAVPIPVKSQQSRGATSGSLPQARLESTERRVEAASELVTVPQGVTIRVKRSRTVQHTISVNWNVSGELSGSASVVTVVNLSIKSAIEKSKETTYEESETVEYEVELNGSASTSYKLVWSDIWRSGTVQVEANHKMHAIPFEYRDRSELNVIPVPMQVA